MRVLYVDAFDFVYIGTVGLIDQFLPAEVFCFVVARLDSFADYHVEIEPRRHEDAGVVVPKEYCWEFEFIEEKSKFEPWFEGIESLVFSQHQNWVDDVVIVHCIFYEAFSVLDIAS